MHAKHARIQWICALLAVFLLLFFPLFVLAQGGVNPPPAKIVPDCADKVLIDPGTGQPTGGVVEEFCGYCDLMTLADNIIRTLIFIATVIAILMIIFAGFLYLTAGSDTGQVSRAHRVFRISVFGLVLVLAAWLIIDFIVRALIGNNGFIGDPWTLPGC